MTERFQRKKMPNRTSRRLVTGVMPFTFGFKWIDLATEVIELILLKEYWNMKIPTHLGDSLAVCGQDF